MSRSPALLPLLLDGPELDLARTRECLSSELPDLAVFDLTRTIELMLRLPSGLIHAEAIWLTAVPPVGLAPLAPGSSWYALERALVVALPPGQPLEALALDLGRYAIVAADVQRRLAGAADLTAALAAGPRLTALAAAELALRFDVEPDRIALLEEQAPGLKADLAAMARGSFAPRVHLHLSTRPAKWRRLGGSIAKRVLEAVPEGPLRLFFADTTEAIEHLSPYVRDLGRELAAWAAENPNELSTPGLLEAFGDHDGPGAAHDLAALVVPDLIRGRPEVIEERRKVERGAGLELYDEAGIVFGVADLALLASPDPRAIPSGVRGRLVAIAGPAEDTLLESARALLESGRIAAIGAALGVPDAGGVVVPEVVLGEDDAVVLEGANRITRRADGLGIRARLEPRLSVDDRREACSLVLALLSLVRRAELLGVFPSGGRRAVALYDRAPLGLRPSLEQRIGALDAARLALAAISAGEIAMPHRGVDAPKPSGSLRFRA